MVTKLTLQKNTLLFTDNQTFKRVGELRGKAQYFAKPIQIQAVFLFAEKEGLKTYYGTKIL
jgi:hypothetical protein